MGATSDPGPTDGDLRDADLTHDGTLDVHGQPASKKTSGGWRAAMFILALQVCTSTAFFGIANNLVIYLTTVMHEGNATAAKTVSNWLGTGYVTPLIGAFVADAFWGRYWTALASCVIYIVGSGLLTVAASLPWFHPPQCPSKDFNCQHSSVGQTSFLYVGLYLMDLGAGGVYGTITALGGDQFDEEDEQEEKQKSSFFNWFYQSMFTGSLVASTFCVYIQDSVSWAWGWGISSSTLVVATLFLILGAPRYRHHKPRGDALARMSKLLMGAFAKRREPLRETLQQLPQEAQLEVESIAFTEEAHGIHRSTTIVRFLDKAATVAEEDKELPSNPVGNPCKICSWHFRWSGTQADEVKFVIRVFPIWLTSIMYSTVYSQIATLFIMQGATMDLNMGSIRIPPASLSVFESSSVILWVVIYDRLLVPFLRRRTGNQQGISGLQRIGIGLALSILAMIIAATVEVQRLRLARKHNLLEDTHTPVPMTVFWEVPQYIVMGASEVFTYIGLIEFFYSQAPHAIRSLSGALSMLGVALGNFLSSCLVSVINCLARRYHGGGPGWIADNLNQGRIDLFYTLLAVLSFLNLLVFVVFACRHKNIKLEVTKKARQPEEAGKGLELPMDKLILPLSSILN